MDTIKKYYELQERNDKPKNTPKNNKDKIQKAIKLYKDGLTQKEIAQKLDVTEQTVLRWLKPIKKRIKIAQKNTELLHEKINNLLNENAPISEVQKVINTLEKYRLLL